MPNRRSAVIIVSLLLFFALVGAALLSGTRYKDTLLKAFPFLKTTLAPVKYPEYVAPRRELTSAEKEALDIPLHGASDREKQQHAELVVSLAKTMPVLDVTGCKPEPLVYRADLNGRILIKNNDAIPHIVRYLDARIKVPANGTTSVRTSLLFQKAGDYGYGCDNPFAKMGVLMVR